MKTKHKVAIRGAVLTALAAGWGVVVVMCRPPQAALADDPPQPAFEATDFAVTQPAATLTDEQAGRILERDSIGPRRAEFTQEEWVSMDRPLDRQLNEKREYTLEDQAFYILLRHVKKDIEPDGSNADEPSVKNLLANPLQYRARPIRMQLQFNTKMKDYTPATNEPYEKLSVISAYVPVAHGEPQGVFVICPDQPQEMGQNQKFEAVGYFYKVVLADHGTKDVPIIIARKVTPLEPRTREFGIQNVGMMVALVALVIVYIFVRTRLGRKREPATTYRPRRFEMTAEEDQRSRVDVGVQAQTPCPKCGSTARGDAAFCSNCGADLTGSQPKPPEDQPK